jgi:hypothetical protein
MHQPKKKKVKTTSIEQEQVQLAVALSKSLVDDEMQANVTRHMLKSELVSIDTQIEVLQV